MKDKLDHIQSLGVDSIWLSPFYEFGKIDMGNDVKNHTLVDEDFGTQQELDDLFEEIKRRGKFLVVAVLFSYTQ